MSLPLDGPQWRFALDFYRLPGLAASCLTLQEAADVDVVLLIFAIYCSRIRGIHLHLDELDKASEYVRAWRDASVLPLRSVRQDLKTRQSFPPEETEDLRNRVKGAELLAEQVEFGLLAEWLDSRGGNGGEPLDQDSARSLVEAIVLLHGGGERPWSDKVEAAVLRITEATVVFGVDGGGTI